MLKLGINYLHIDLIWILTIVNTHCNDDFIVFWSAINNIRLKMYLILETYNVMLHLKIIL